MRIGELSKQAEVSRDTIRLYERMGLLLAVSQPHKWNNYKEYGEDNVRRLAFIKSLKQFGFTLKECREILTFIDNNEDIEGERRTRVAQKSAALDDQIAALTQTRHLLVEFLESPFCQNQPNGSCMLHPKSSQTQPKD